MFHRSLPLTEWFAAHPKIFPSTLLFIPQVHTVEAESLWPPVTWSDVALGRHAKRFSFVLQERTEGVRLMRQMQQTGLSSCCNSMSLAILHKYVWWICPVYYFRFNLFSVPANLWHKCPMWFGFQVYCPWVVFASYHVWCVWVLLFLSKKNNNNNNSLASQLPCVKWLWRWECTGVPDNEFNSHHHHVPVLFTTSLLPLSTFQLLCCPCLTWESALVPLAMSLWHVLACAESHSSMTLLNLLYKYGSWSVDSVS